MWRLRQAWRSHSITPVAGDHYGTGTDLLHHELHGYGPRCHTVDACGHGGVIREKDEESARHPPAMRRPATRPDAKRLHNDVARTSSAAFPSVSRGRFLAAKIGASGHAPGTAGYPALAAHGTATLFLVSTDLRRRTDRGPLRQAHRAARCPSVAASAAVAPARQRCQAVPRPPSGPRRPDSSPD